MKLLALTILSLLLIASASAQTLSITRSGPSPPSQGPAENFTGSVRVTPLLQARIRPARPAAPYRLSPVPARHGIAIRWGQTLIVTAASAAIQQWGGPVEEIRKGDVVWIPPGVKHWHGASPAHRDGPHRYSRTPRRQEPRMAGKGQRGAVRLPLQASSLRPAASSQPTPAQRLIGDFSPKLVELTDKVLFGDVWARPQLSPRDRSLVTVSALIAMNRPDQLRSHLARARDNGVTQEELVETITHLAFYAGWPSAMTAVSVAKEVFEKK